MLLSDDAEFVEECGIYKHDGRRERGHDLIERVGYNFRMTEMQAAIGVAQLGRIDEFIARKRANQEAYMQGLADVPEVEPLAARDYSLSSCYNAVIRVDGRDELYAHLDADGIDSNVHFYPNHLLKIFRPYTTRLPVTEEVWEQILSIPLHPLLTDVEQRRVVASVRSFVQGAQGSLAQAVAG